MLKRSVNKKTIKKFALQSIEALFSEASASFKKDTKLSGYIKLANKICDCKHVFLHK